MDSLKGQLLVANPKLPDENFYKSVVYILQHDEEGGFGVILNRPSSFPLREVWHAITENSCCSTESIYLGGPVEGPLLAIHDRLDCADEEIEGGIYLSNQKGSLGQLFGIDEAQMRVFSGYSGWGSGQLECEIAAGGWFQTPAEFEDVFLTDEDLWQKVAGRIGHRIVFQEQGGWVDRFDASLN
jgi:putative transcriptional regulator